MKEINPYLHFHNETQEAFHFYRAIFGGEFKGIQQFKDVPEKDRQQGGITEDEGEKIMHIALPLPDGTVLMGSDTPESMNNSEQGSRISLAIETESKEEADRLFNGLSAGGTVSMEMMDTFWGAYYGMCTDKFGIGWMINYTYPGQ